MLTYVALEMSGDCKTEAKIKSVQELYSSW